MASFTLPAVVGAHPTGWGPIFVGDKDDALLQTPLSTSESGGAPSHSQLLIQHPFPISLKFEKLGRVCDFTFQTQQRAQQQSLKQGPAVPKESANKDDEDFKLVDSAKPPKDRKRPYRRGTPNTDGYNRAPWGRQMWNQNRGGMRGGQNWRNQPQNNKNRPQQSKWAKQQQQRQQHFQQQQSLFAEMGGQGSHMYPMRRKIFSEWSTEINPQWTQMTDIPMNHFPKLALRAQDVKKEDFDWRGELPVIDKQNDRVNPKKPKMVKNVFQDYALYWYTASRDETLYAKLLADDSIQIAATAQVLSVLMAATQSRYSWHLRVNRYEGRVFIDKDSNSIVDRIQINETSPATAPNPEDSIRANRPKELSIEALRLQQNFSQNILSRDEPPTRYELPAFAEENDRIVARAYRYRVITLPPLSNTPAGTPKSKPIKIVTQAEIDGIIPRNSPDGEDRYALARMLMEINNTKDPWSTQLEKQKGALAATEFRANSCLVSRWAAQALLADADSLCLGWTNRVTPNDPSRHKILAVQTHSFDQLRQQIGLQPSNAWAVLRYILDYLMHDVTEDGEYIIMKEPLKPTIRIYYAGEDEAVSEAPEM